MVSFDIRTRIMSEYHSTDHIASMDAIKNSFSKGDKAEFRFSQVSNKIHGSRTVCCCLAVAIFVQICWWYVLPNIIGTQRYGVVSIRGPHLIRWELRRPAIERALQHRDAALGTELLPEQTKMGDISSSGVTDQIKRYSDWATQTWVRTVCEVGFAIGTSSIVYLESNPNLRVIAFDTMSIPRNASQKALLYLKARYGSHRINIIEGDSQFTLLSHLHTYGGICDLISVDGMHDMRAYTDILNFRPYASPSRHVLLADDCVSRNVYEKGKAYHPDLRWFGDVWESWRRLVDQDSVVRELAIHVHGGEEVPVVESFTHFLKGWCEGEYILGSI